MLIPDNIKTIVTVILIAVILTMGLVMCIQDHKFYKSRKAEIRHDRHIWDEDKQAATDEVEACYIYACEKGIIE